MKYEVCLTSRAAREVEALRGDVAAALGQAIAGLASSPRPAGCVKLTLGQEWRIRVRDYRVRYLIDDAAGTVTVTHVAHRSKAY